MVEHQRTACDYVETGKAPLGEVVLTNLTPNSCNARRHDERNLSLIEQAIREVGAARAVVRDNVGSMPAEKAA